MNNNIKLIMADIKDYELWKCGNLLLDMESGEFVDVLAGVEIRKKLVKKIQKDDGLFCPESFEDLTISEQLLGALTYEEFKYITIHLDKKVLKKVLNNVISIVIQYYT